MAESSSSKVGCSPSAFADLVENGKNKTKINCRRCKCLVLSPRSAVMVEKEFFLPHMYKKHQAQPLDGEDLKAFWLIKNMYTFENVGFTNTVDSIKYLICAECEVGPIGWHHIADKDTFYLAVERVKYE